jgi:HK97 family phage prohead protease
MNKQINSYSVKSFGTELKDLSLHSREVAVYLSVFDAMDSDNDIIRKGAFKKSINDKGPESSSNRKIAFLRHHDWEQQIGKFLRLEEDSKGLFAVGKLGTSTRGEDALRDYEEGIINEHSIGFQYMTDRMKWIEDDSVKGGGYWDIMEVKLWEGSAVTFGANEYTNVLDVVKSGKKEDTLDKISEEMGIVVKSLINGKGSDERLFELEMKLKFLNSRLVELARTEPFVKEHPAAELEVKSEFDWNKVGELLIKN